jgi:hypothetical protein
MDGPAFGTLSRTEKDSKLSLDKLRIVKVEIEALNSLGQLGKEITS